MITKAKPYSRYVMVGIETIKHYIDNHPLQHRTAAELLDSLSAPNRSIVEKAFKETYGSGIKEYQVRQRLEASKKFLEMGLTKKQVASKCFYKGQASFCRAFKKEFSITPTDWQNGISVYSVAV